LESIDTGIIIATTDTIAVMVIIIATVAGDALVPLRVNAL
jgi:hypothetical protein